MIREVLRYPHPALKQVARELGPDEHEKTARVATDLLDTMASFGHCVGLAATQLDPMVRVLVVDVSEHPKATESDGLLILVNPRIALDSGAEVTGEGCLSVPADSQRAAGDRGRDRRLRQRGNPDHRGN